MAVRQPYINFVVLNMILFSNIFEIISKSEFKVREIDQLINYGSLITTIADQPKNGVYALIEILTSLITWNVIASFAFIRMV